MAVLNKNHRKFKAAWRKPFKRDWKHLQTFQVEPHDLIEHHTNPLKWTCACQSFLLSRFLICKHIIACYRVPSPIVFFSEVCRQKHCPFWVRDQLLLRPEYGFSEINGATNICDDDIDPQLDLGPDAEVEAESDPESDPQSEVYSDSDSDPDPDSDSDACSDNGENEVQNSVEQANEDDFSEHAARQTDSEDFFSTTESLIALARDQDSKGNTKWVERFKESNAKNVSLYQELMQQKRQRTMPKTWNKNSLVMFFE